ncbi:MAG TPA: glycosyl hydrolase [Candidatus Acidoferrum sp.]|nr:glycosyl hydrolase [Candidatus Acidoferrum sp.]
MQRLTSTSGAARPGLRRKDRVLRLLTASRTAGKLVAALTLLALLGAGAGADELDKGFADPPRSARLRAYWWWLNGNVTKASITRDLEEMKAKGFGGALICDAGGAEQDGNDRVPHGPTFFTPEWRELYKHTLREADRLGLEMSLNILSGWNLGGPFVTQDDAAKKLTWSEAMLRGPDKFDWALPAPKARDHYYRDITVVAYRIREDPAGTNRPPRQPIRNWPQKAVYATLNFSAPDTSPLFDEAPAVPGEEDTHAADVLDLTTNLSTNGLLHWQIPPGTWQVLRFGCTIGDHSRVSTCSDGWQGYALDVLDAGAFERYWDAVVEPLIADAGPLASHALKYLHTDSWEVEAINWTPTLREEFRKRRGYDPLPFLPVMAGRIVDSRPVSNRFLDDYRKTLGDLAIDNHYRLFRDRAHKHGLQIHPESGGPHAVPIDAQRCLGMDDAPMSEFWAWSWTHRIGDTNRFFVKQPASAAHTYGHPLVVAEGFTDIGPHWQESLADNLKPSLDRALCEGMNLLVWHAFVCSPAEMGVPGQQYFAGTHFNPNSTWWAKSSAFLAYINRCQFLLQRGLFVADACYYYGDHVPNFAQLKRVDPARVLPGYDYDVATEECVLKRMSVRQGRIVLPDGMSYRVLVLPGRDSISLPVLQKVRQLVKAGATVIGPKPARTHTLTGYPQCDAEVARIADELWGNWDSNATGQHGFGKGRVFGSVPAREVLLADGLKPDFDYRPAASAASKGAALPPVLDYIHRSAKRADIYFVSNPSNASEAADCTFRVAGKTPELWDPVSGSTRPASAWSAQDGRTTLPLQFPPNGSMFVVFRKPAPRSLPKTARPNFPSYGAPHELTGPWTVRFDPKWGGPASAIFDELTSWAARPEPGIKYFSGTATYRKSFDLPEALRPPGRHVALDLGEVKELAEVRLNGKSLGVLWAKPFRVDITDAARPTNNELEIEVVNFWPNRIIGDQSLPPEKRLTRTNIRKLTKDTPLMPSGLLGPVRLLEEQP